jgi:CMP-N-acetylneuraminic acid synthetase
MRTLGIIPARGGSQRVPGKNKRMLAGKPLVSWVVEAALKTRKLERIVVSSDDEEILSLAESYSPSLALRRPDEISGDQSPAIEYVRHALTSLESEGEVRFDVVVILQPSSPLTLAEDIDAVLDLLERTQADTAVSVVQLDHAIHPAKLKLMQGDRLIPYLENEKGRMATRELPEIFVRNCAVYATSRQVIESGVIIGDDCRGYVMPRERSIDINEEMDLVFAEFLLNKGVGSLLES